MYTLQKKATLLLFLALALLWVSPSFAAKESFDLRAMDPPKLRLFIDGDFAVGSELILEVTIDPAWHINADTTADEFLLPSKIDIVAEGWSFAKAIWPKPQKLYSEALAMENLVLGGTFQIRMPITKLSPDAKENAQVTLHYQACSNVICLAPASVTTKLGDLTSSPLDLKKKDSNAVVNTNAAPHSLIVLLFFAFVGGLILNLMPCVLPVLSIKALSLAKHAQEGRKRLLALGGAMTLGILISFWILAAFVIIIQQAGGIAGWGFQFQNPYFVIGMLLLVTLFALNMFGLFEIWLPSSAQTGMSKKATNKGYVGAFFNGVLMTLLSTPCSAPFLGTAMAFAFTQSPITLVLFFTAAGLGLALPYMLLSLFPSTLKWIPKPGTWMLHFKQFLGFLLLATSAWLLSVVGSAIGTSTQDSVLLLLIILAIGTWFIGLFAPPGVAFYKVIIAWSAVIFVLALIWIFSVQPSIHQNLKSQTEITLTANTNSVPTDSKGHYIWSVKNVEILRAQGKTIFVDYTADWCITCKANEKAVISRSDVQQIFKDMDIAFMVADFTKANPQIAESLKSFGRSGVPLYVIHSADTTKAPIVLPEILTKDILIDGLMQAGPSL